MNIYQMKAAIAEHPGWNTLDAFRALTGVEPTEAQLEQLHKYGGLNDKQTRDSLPYQIDRRKTWMNRAYPMIVHDYTYMYNLILLGTYKPKMNDINDATVVHSIEHRIRVMLDALTFKRPTVLDVAFEYVMGKPIDPDNAGVYYGRQLVGLDPDYPDGRPLSEVVREWERHKSG